MTDRGPPWLERPTPQWGWRLLRAVALVALAPLWALLILFLPFARVLVQAPLALAAIGGFGFGVYFGLQHAWVNALGAGAVGLCCALALAGFSAIAESIDPEFSRPDNYPPWWWFF